MGRTLIGGSAVSAPTTSTTSSAASGEFYLAQPRKNSRVEGLPLLAFGGTTDSSTNTSRLGLEVIDSLGRVITETSYMANYGGGDWHAASYYSSTYATGAGNGYQGADYYATHLYANQNPSTSNWHTAVNSGGGWGWTNHSPLGHRGFGVDLDYTKRGATFYGRGFNASYGGGYSQTDGGSSVMDSGSWIGPEGTRQTHALVSRYNNPELCLYRNARTEHRDWPTPDRYLPEDGKDYVEWWDYAPADYQAAQAKTSGYAAYPWGSRWSYNENLNRLVFISGYSTYSSQTYCLIWDGAAGKNLFDTPLRDWFEAATATNLGTIQSGFTNFDNAAESHGAKIWLANDGKTIVGWKVSSTNYCFVVDTRPESAGAVTAINRSPSGSTTSYSYAQGRTVHTHEGWTSWDNKWLFMGWVYYYYHCGMISKIFSLDNTDVHANFDDTQTSHNPMISPYGKSGFAFARTNDMSGTQGYMRIADFGETLARYEANGNTGFHYKYNHRNYTTGASAYAPGSYEKIENPTAFDNAHGMVLRTNINVGGSLATDVSTWQMMRTRKQGLFVPTAYMGFIPLDYWYPTLPNGSTNTKDMY